MFEVIISVTYWVVTAREQAAEYCARRAGANWNNPGCDPSIFLEGMDHEEYARRFRPFVVVEATTKPGGVYRYAHRELDESEAATLVTRIEEAGKINPEHWEYWRTAYGSEAYFANDVEGQVADLERAYDEGDAGAFRDLWKAM